MQQTFRFLALGGLVAALALVGVVTARADALQPSQTPLLIDAGLPL